MIKITIDDITITDLGDICESFNKYYVNVGPNLAKSIPTQKTKLFKLPSVNISDSFSHPLATEKEIIDVTKIFKPKSSFGHDSISSKLVKSIGESVSKPLMHVINLSFTTGIIPDDMKKAKVVPIFKNSGSREIMKNYRPVSLLPTFSKIIERLVYNRLYSFLKKYNVLVISQYGFQKYLSTELAILELHDRIAKMQSVNDICAGLFKKLHHYGARG